MRSLAAALALLAAGCGDKPPAEPPAGAIVDESAADYARDPGPKPFLVNYRPATDGGPRAIPPGIVRGVLDFTGPCVRIQDHAGVLKTVVTPSGSKLMRDSMGWFLSSGSDRLRHGASVDGSGGEMASLPLVGQLAESVPADCLSGPSVELTEWHRSQRD